MTTAWSSILQTAIAGAERRALDPDVFGLLGLPPESNLWDAAAAARIMQKAAGVEAIKEVAPPPPLEATALPLPPQGAIDALEGILFRGHTPALPEWLHLASRNHFAPPPEWLPALLDHLSGSLEAVQQLGPRAAWLARQHPRWEKWYNNDPNIWETGDFPGRLSHLHRLRRADPGSAAALLASTWHTESAAHQVRLLEVLRHEPVEQDLPLLEQAVQSRSKEVRLIAFRLLCLHGGYEPVRQLIKQVESVYPAIDALQLQPPFDKVFNNQKKPEAELLSALPPGVGAQHSGDDPLSYLNASTEPLAIVQAIVWHRAKAWAAPALHFMLEHPELAKKNLNTFKAMVRLKPEVAVPTVLNHPSASYNIRQALDDAVQTHAFQPEFQLLDNPVSDVILNALADQGPAASAFPGFWKTLAYRSNPEYVLSRHADPALSHLSNTSDWRNTLKSLLFRSRMCDAFGKKPA